MAKRNMSDIIESYLKRFLSESEQIEIKRSDIAERFDCVPSQVNYVINTRFTQAHGYQVESKRGGGGYIRIVRIQYSDAHDFLMDILNKMPEKMTVSMVQDLMQLMFNEKIVTEREGNLLLATLSHPVLTDLQRAILLTSTIHRLDKMD